MTDGNLEPKEESQIFSYSLTPRLAYDVAFILGFSLIASVDYLLYHDVAIVWATVIGIGFILLFRDLRQPLRKIRFYDNYFEFSGRKTSALNVNYDELEDLSKEKDHVGYLTTSSAVWFSIKGDSNYYVLPNRKVGMPKVELYSWLLQKNPEAGAGSQNSV